MKLKFRYILVLIMIVSAYSTEAQEWRQVAKGSFQALNDIYFVDKNNGFCAGFQGALIKTTDGGKTWQEQLSGTDQELFDICFSTQQKGYISAEDLLILKTTDAGETWLPETLSVVPDPKADIMRIFFADELNGWAIASTSSKGWILHTTDGGLNWNIDHTVPSQIYDISVYDGKYAVVTGKKNYNVYYSRDGVNWNTSDTCYNFPEVYPIRSDIRTVYMVNESLVYAAGWGTAISGLQPSIIIRSTDGGTSWTYLTRDSINCTYDNLYGIYFKDELNGIAVGGGGAGGAVVTVTSDGGTNWRVADIPFGSALNSVTSVDGVLWICGNGGLIASSEDFGTTWKMVSLIPSHNLNAIDFANDKSAFAAGFNGVLLTSTDGGEQWEGSYLDNGLAISNINDLFFVNSSIGFAAHSYGAVSKTTDGGLSWIPVISDTNYPQTKSNSVHFINENVGFVVGQVANELDFIYKTTDGGSTWITKTGIGLKELRSVSFFDQNKGVTVGAGLKILYTTDSGENWNVPVINNVPSEKYQARLRSADFAGSNTIYAAGEKIMLRSTDAGATWDYVDIPVTGTLNGMAFFDSTTGYCVGENYVLKTTDGGYSWNNIIDSNITGNLLGVTTDNEGFVWICGAAGNIFTNKKQTSGIAENNVIEGFTIAQNYPNPFNPSTVIRYNIPGSGLVDLRIYDVLGREVSTLVNEYQSAGQHEVAFTAGNISSGTYFYQLKFNNRYHTGKMCLIR